MNAESASARLANDRRLIEEADAWNEYLESTRGQSALRYQELETWAWAKLQKRLKEILAT